MARKVYAVTAFIFMAIQSHACFSLELDELAQIWDGHHEPSSGRYTCTQKKYQPSLAESVIPSMEGARDAYAQGVEPKGDPEAAKVQKSLVNQWHRQTILFDVKKNIRKTTTEDLRDIDAIMRKYDIHDNERANVSQSKVKLVQNKYEAALLNEANVVHLSDQVGGGNRLNLDRYLKLGKLPNIELWDVEETDIVITEVEVEGKTMSRISASHKEGASTQIHLDPALGYRYRSMRTYRSDGSVSAEFVLEDYRDVDGYLIPFKVYDRQYNRDGSLKKSVETSIEDADFASPVNDEDFSMVTPAGAVFQAALTGEVVFGRIEKDQTLTLEGLIKKGARIMANKLVFQELETELSHDPIDKNAESDVDINEAGQDGDDATGLDMRHDVKPIETKTAFRSFIPIAICAGIFAVVGGAFIACRKKQTI